VLILACVTGCVIVAPQSTEEQVRQRAQARWDALVAGNVEGAYALLSPGARQARSLPAYRAMIKTGFLEAGGGRSGGVPIIRNVQGDGDGGVCLPGHVDFEPDLRGLGPRGSKVVGRRWMNFCTAVRSGV